MDPILTEADAAFLINGGYYNVTPYNYTLNRPTVLTDPDGKCLDCIRLAIDIGIKVTAVLSNFTKSVGAEIKQRAQTGTLSTNNKVRVGNVSTPAPSKVAVEAALIVRQTAQIVTSSSEAHIGLGRSVGQVKVGNLQVGGSVGAEVGTSGGKAKVSGGIGVASASGSVNTEGEISGSLKVLNSAKGTTSGSVGIDLPVPLTGNTVYVGGTVNLPKAQKEIKKTKALIENIKKTYED